MLSHIFDRISFWSLFLVIVLLPVFFLPFTKIPIETSKGLILASGLVVSIIFWAMARFSDGQIILPKSLLLLSGFGIVVSFFISAIMSSARSTSLFGTMFDIGTFWFIFAVFLLMLVSSVLIKNLKKATLVLFGVIIASAAVLIFQALHLFFPEFLSLGVLGTKTDTIMGSWNAFGIFSGFIATLSLFIIEFFDVSRIIRWLLGILIILSVLLLACVNSPLSWALLGVFSLFIFIYKISFSFNENKESKGSVHFPIISFLLVVISLLFFMAGQLIGGFLPNRLGLSNIEVSPSFSSTMTVGKSVISKNPVLGIGPNRFIDAWAMYKPAEINSTQFWDANFDFGSGLLPTLASTTGILGTLSLLVFIFLFLLTGSTSVFLSLKNSTNQVMPAFFLASLYLLAAAFFYSIGTVLFVLSFAFIGIFIGLFSSSISNGEITMGFSHSPKKSFFALLLLVFIMIVSFAAGFKYMERFISVSYYTKALAAKDIETAEPNIIKANLLYQNDLYLRTYSQVYLLKLNSAVSKGSALTDAEKSGLQNNLDQAISGAQSAIAYNKENYLNYQMLGSVYNVVASFGVAGAYEKAIEAYTQASKLNPLNPGLKLSIASVYFSSGKTKEAKDYANQALSLKPDYVDALVFLSQIAKSEGNNAAAITYAERALAFSPDDKDLIKYVDSLKNPGAPASVKQ